MKDYSKISNEKKHQNKDEVGEMNGSNETLIKQDTLGEAKSSDEKEPELNKEKIYIGIVFNCKRLNVREKDSKDSKVICVINQGDKVKISPLENVDVDDNWAHVELSNGIKGYVMGEFIKEIK